MFSFAPCTCAVSLRCLALPYLALLFPALPCLALPCPSPSLLSLLSPLFSPPPFLGYRWSFHCPPCLYYPLPTLMTFGLFHPNDSVSPKLSFYSHSHCLHHCCRSAGVAAANQSEHYASLIGLYSLIIIIIIIISFLVLFLPVMLSFYCPVCMLSSPRLRLD